MEHRRLLHEDSHDSLMRQDSTTTILHDHDQPRLERSYTSSSEIEKGHPPKPAKSRHYFGIKLFLQKLLKLDPQESPEEGKLIKPGDVQLHDALAELSKLCDNIQTPNIEGNQTSDTEILTVITLKIIAALDILITANRSPQPPARATIDTILKHIGKEDSFLNSFQNFSNHHLIYHNDTNVFDSPELKWALFQIYWMLRDLAQNTTNRHDLTPEHVHSRALRLKMAKARRAALSYLFMWFLIFLCFGTAIATFVIGWMFTRETPDNGWDWHAPTHHDPAAMFCYSTMAFRLGGIFIGVRPLVENPQDYHYKSFLWFSFILAFACSAIAGGLCEFSTPGYLVPGLAGDTAVLFGLGALIEAQAETSKSKRTNSFGEYWKQTK